MYKLRRTTIKHGERSYIQYSLGLPPEIGERVEGRTFRVTVTDQGILYTPMDDSEVFGHKDQLSAASWLN